MIGPVRVEDAVREIEPAYRSRGEATLGRMLRHHHVPFLYERRTPVIDRAGLLRLWYPDFTLPRPRHDDLLVEYTHRDPLDRALKTKQIVYDTNGYNVLWARPDDLRGPAWPQRLLGRIEAAAEFPACSRDIQPAPHLDRPGYR